MNYLITGSAGFIGTNLTSYLLSKGEKIVGLDYPQCDLCYGLPSLTQYSKFDVIVHLATETDVRNSISLPVKNFLRNCQSTLNILELARSQGSKFIFTSSQAASYCLSPYGASKLACESLIESYRNSYGLNAVILRLSNVYGPHSIHKTSVVAEFIKAKLDNRPARIYGSGEQVRDFIYVRDVCEAIANADKDLTISTGKLTSINKLLEMLSISTVHYLHSIKGEINSVDRYSEVSYSIDLEQGLSQTLKWFEENYK